MGLIWISTNSTDQWPATEHCERGRGWNGSSWPITISSWSKNRMCVVNFRIYDKWMIRTDNVVWLKFFVYMCLHLRRPRLRLWDGFLMLLYMHIWINILNFVFLQLIAFKLLMFAFSYKITLTHYHYFLIILPLYKIILNHRTLTLYHFLYAISQVFTHLKRQHFSSIFFKYKSINSFPELHYISQFILCFHFAVVFLALMPIKLYLCFYQTIHFSIIVWF